MKKRQFKFHDGKSGAAIAIHVEHPAARDEIRKILEDGTIIVCLTAKQSGESINKFLLQFLSDVLGVKVNQMEIVAGSSSDDKLIAIVDLDKESVQERIYRNISDLK